MIVQTKNKNKYYFSSSKLNNIDNQTLYYTMVQIW